MPLPLSELLGITPPATGLPADPLDPPYTFDDSVFDEAGFQQVIGASPIDGDPSALTAAMAPSEPVEGPEDPLATPGSPPSLQAAVEPPGPLPGAASPGPLAGRYFTPEAPPPEFTPSFDGGTGATGAFSAHGTPAVGFGDTEALAAPQPLAASPLSGDLTRDQEGDRQAQLSDEQLFIEHHEREQAREQFRREEAQAAREDFERERKAAVQDYRDARLQARQDRERLEQEAKEAANEPGLNLAQSILGVIASGLSGFFNPGEPNQGLALIKGMVDQRRQDRKDEFERRYRAIGANLEDAAFEMEMAEKEAIASYEFAVQQTADQVQGMDPNGTQVAQAQFAIRGFRAEQAAAAAKLEQVAFDRRIAENEELRKQQTSDLEMRRYNDAVRQRAINAANARANARARAFEDITKRFDNLAEKELIDLESHPTPEAWAAAGAPVRRSSIKTLQGQQEESETEFKAARAKTQNLAYEKDLAQIQIPDPSSAGGKKNFLTNQTGEAARFNSNEEAKDGRMMMSVAQDIRDATDMIKTLRAKHGGSLKSLKSSESQQILNKIRHIHLRAKNLYHLGVLSGNDEQILKEAQGDVDPTSYVFDAEPGLEAMANTLEDSVNTTLRGTSDYDGPAWRARRSNAAVALERPTEELSQSITAPIPPHVKTPDQRAQYVKKAGEDAAVFAQHRNPSLTDLASHVELLDRQVRSKQLTRAEALQIAGPILDQVKKSRTSDAWKKGEYEDLNVSKDSTPEQVYDALRKHLSQ